MFDIELVASHAHSVVFKIINTKFNFDWNDSCTVEIDCEAMVYVCQCNAFGFCIEKVESIQCTLIIKQWSIFVNAIFLDSTQRHLKQT